MDSTDADYEARIQQFLEKLNRIRQRYDDDEQLLVAPLEGLHYAFKSVRFVSRLHRELMSNTPNVEEAGYLAEAMVRSVHSAGDLLALVIVECGFYTPGSNELIGINTMAKKLSGPLQRKIEAFTRRPAWKYLNAFSNTSKHKAFIDRTYRPTADSHEILFRPFTDHWGKRHNRRSFGVVRGYTESVMAGVEGILDWLLLNHPPAPRQVRVDTLGPTYSSGVCATSSVPSLADFTYRSHKLSD